ncbi:MAG TPA: alpha/beta fold hydrolase [Candidatus Limnocylindrales bacterium]|nr:alpha/beta fold hydrolase [Candidatus Limnocylindrales bacterium]
MTALSTPTATEIRPFEIAISDEDLDDLRRRLDSARGPATFAGDGWERGVPVAYLRRIADYWRTSFDWRSQEERLNAFPQFVTTIDGQPIHFLHVRSSARDAIPLVICHGYPSSIAEFTDLVGPLTDPQAHGLDTSVAFDVVVPSLPGFGFSTPLAETGWNLGRTAKAIAELMRRLGYERYGAHGGDIGAGISGMLAAYDAEHVVGTHVLSDPLVLGLIEGMLPADTSAFSEPHQTRLAELAAYGKEGRGYLAIQGTRPMTVGYGLGDSPIGQLAWIVEKFQEWTDASKPLPEDAVDLDQLLTNVSIYWFTNSATSAANFLYEAAHSFDWPGETDVPTAWGVFGDKAGIIRAVLDPGQQVGHWSEFDRGGHFAAMEAPDLLAADLRDFFGGLRPS